MDLFCVRLRPNYGAIIVVIRSERIFIVAVGLEAGFFGYVRESSISIVTPHQVVAFRSGVVRKQYLATFRNGARNIQIQITIVVVVDECLSVGCSRSRVTRGLIVNGNSGSSAHIFECAVLFIVQKHNTIPEIYRQVRKAIVIVISSSAGKSRAHSDPARRPSSHLQTSRFPSCIRATSPLGCRCPPIATRYFRHCRNRGTEAEALTSSRSNRPVASLSRALVPTSAVTSSTNFTSICAHLAVPSETPPPGEISPAPA